MQGTITEKTFFQYLKCANWIYFDTHTDQARPHVPLMQQLQDQGLIHEMQRDLISDKEDLAEVTAEDPDEAFRQTLEFMREGRQSIYRGTLIDKHWVGNPDLLERVEGRSGLGDYYYVAADIKHTRQVRDDHMFQGCFYAELLERVQGTKPVQGYVITPDNVVHDYLIEDFEAQYSLNLGEIEKIVAGKRPAHFVTSGCKQSPWFKECLTESESCNDLSLLNRVWRDEVRRLAGAGVKTVSELAVKSVPELEALVPNVNPSRLETMRDQAIAIHDHRHIIRADIELPEASIELFFDIEADPLRDFIYLFGVYEVTDKGEQYYQFFAETPEQEGAMWQEFITFIEGRIDAPIYHYGWYEQDVIRHFSAKFGISEIAREALHRNMIDILSVIRPAIIFPLYFYSLKDIATYIGFNWRSKDASGANSVVWFEEWLKKKSPKLLKKIVEYNEDDVIATYKLQRWVREHAGL
ncbi:TM0106 family RecB-like putative nuclease [Candidatus Uhrbacteria bacterium]|jgi:predicted RecB family nuclease|nr:TM0106 family RecB-like putative nuclease [Candidatus Uhrbacteria bacterium]